MARALSDQLRDRFETTDGSRPEASPISERDASSLPLSAFSILRGGDVFERASGNPPDLKQEVARWIDSRVDFRIPEGLGADPVDRVRRDLERQLGGNRQLIRRLECAKELIVDLIAPGRSIAGAGYPRAVSRRASGLFWDHPDWPRARIALRVDRLQEDPVLVIHEMAHAIHYLAFTEVERKLIYGLLGPTFGSRAAMDEVFAIYSEREFVREFSDRDRRAPGVYGVARREWSENHVFTRFVRKLYLPHVPAAGPGMRSGASPGDWMTRL